MKKITAISVLLLILLSGMSLSALSRKSKMEPVGMEDLTFRLNEFGFDCLRMISRDQAGQNVFLSPLSLSLALTMLNNGAGGNTREQMDEMLHYSGLSMDEINPVLQNLARDLLTLDPRIDLRIANSLWYRYQFKVKKPYLEQIRKFYDAEIKGLDFDAPETPSLINSWVSEKTSSKIERIITSDIDPLMVMYLINVIYFKGDWQVQFDPKRTKSETFAGTEKCEMMSMTADLSYWETDRFQAVNLPYGQGDFSMTVILPAEDVAPAEIISDFNMDYWLALQDEFHPLNGFLALPRFRIEYDITLNQLLRQLGMEEAFDRDLADFNAISDSPLYVSQVLQKTFLEVNEEGTEAAAATMIGMKTVSIQEPGFVMKVNRPFLLFIQQGDLLLFGGWILSLNN